MSNRSIGRNASSVGMMEGAFFVGRTELLEWVNRLLEVNLTKVEQCASGAIYCQIVDSCHPGTVKMAKVNWMARSDHEFIPNYKLLQASFDKNSIQKHVPVDMLIRGKYQDNLEFLQWMKAMWDREGTGRSDYEPVRARDGRPTPAWAKGRPLAEPDKENVSTNRSPARSAGEKGYPAAQRAGTTKAAAPLRGTTPRTTAKVLASGPLPTETLKQQLSNQEEEITELHENINSMETERDYYFRKLRKVEAYCEHMRVTMDPALDAIDIINKVQGMLYEENDEEDDLNFEATPVVPVELEFAVEQDVVESVAVAC